MSKAQATAHKITAHHPAETGNITSLLTIDTEALGQYRFALVDFHRAASLLRLVNIAGDQFGHHDMETEFGRRAVVNLMADFTRTVDLVTKIVERTDDFLDRFEVKLRPHAAKGDMGDLSAGEIRTPKPTSQLAALIDEYNWAYDAYDEACGTQDSFCARYDPSKAAKGRFLKAEHRQMNAEIALADYRPADSAELRLKIMTIGKLREKEIFPEELLDNVIESLQDFCKSEANNG